MWLRWAKRHVRRNGCDTVIQVWLQYSTSSRLVLPITSSFRAGGKFCRRWTYIFPIILTVAISIITVVVVIVLPTSSAARKLCRSSSVVLTVMTQLALDDLADVG